MTSKLSECFWPPLFQTNRISRRINNLSENLTQYKTVSLKISHITHPFLSSVNISQEKITHLNRTASSVTVLQALNSPTLSL